MAATPIPQEAQRPMLANSKLSTLLSTSQSATPTTLSLIEKEPQARMPRLSNTNETGRGRAQPLQECHSH